MPTPPTFTYSKTYDEAEVLIEGPERANDFTFRLIEKCKDLQILEKGIDVENFHNKLRDRKFDMEFRILCRMTQSQFHFDNLEKHFDIEFKKLNRYKEVLPFKHNLIKLPQRMERGNFSSYINADYINSSLKSVGEKAFIASQNPLIITRQAFWEMVYVENVDTIVMLCEIVEDIQQNSDIYWIDTQHEILDMGFLNVKMVQKEMVSNNIQKRTLILSNIEEGISRSVHHYQYINWEDDNIPSEADINEVYELVKIVDGRRFKVNEIKRPIIVHCSAGIGRTGTFIAIYNIIEAVRALQKQSGEEDIQLDEAESEQEENFEKDCMSTKPRISIFGSVRRLREQRWSMVKIQSQYNFIYHFIDYWISSLM